MTVVGPMRLRTLIRRQRRCGAALFAVLAVSGAIAAHHAMPTMSASMHHGDGMTASAVELCLGVLTAVGAIAAAVAIGVFMLRRLRGVLVVLAPALSVFVSPLPVPRARAGPSFLCVMRC